jgi:glycosyltransferase involved in cell wall biosynthesis
MSTPMPRQPRVAILQQGFVPRYRVRFYEMLHERSEIEYVVFHGSPPAGTGHVAAQGPFAFPNVWTDNRQFRIAGRVLIYQPIVRRMMATRWDAIVVAPWVRLVSNLILVPLFQARGRAVIAWGHGYEKAEDDGEAITMLLRVMAGLKAWFARSVDGYLLETYTTRGAEHLAAIGVAPERVHAVRNTLDMSEQIALHERLASISPEAIRSALGLREDSAVLLCIGRIYREKRVDEFVEVIRRLRASRPDLPVEGVVIGDGPELPRVRAEAAGLDGVHFRGEVHDQEAIARHMRVASAVVIPSALGLVVNHALAHGVPVITRRSLRHGPELDYIEPGVNGLVVDGDLDEFAAAIAEVIASPDRQRALAQGALKTRSELTLDEMVRAFDDGVAASLSS